MTSAIPIISSLLAVVSALGSAWLVYKASSNSTDVASRGQSFTQQQDTIDGLRADVAELDEERRNYYERNKALLRSIERYRAWGYGLVRLLNDNGIHSTPPEPTETP